MTIPQERPDVAGVLQAAAYATFRLAAPRVSTAKESTRSPGGVNGNFILHALRETHEIVAAAVGGERARELRRTGAAMGLDEAVSYALAHIDPKLLTGPISSIGT